MAKPAKFSHVVYMTRRFEEMIAWYEAVFEARVVYETPVFAFLTYDDEHHRIAFANLDLLRPGGKGRDDRGEIGVNHVAYTYSGAGELLETYARLRERQLQPYWSIHHGITLSMYYRDPDGNRLELQVDVGTPEEARAFMASEAFAANAVGVEYDPEALLARYRAGASEAELLTQPAGTFLGIPAEHGIT